MERIGKVEAGGERFEERTDRLYIGRWNGSLQNPHLSQSWSGGFFSF